VSKHADASQYTDTSGVLARDSETTTPTVRLYADLDLLDYIVISNGVRLFRKGQAEAVRRIYADRMANRGRKAG
jgi:DNA-binding transcriptional MerR regulator